MPRRCDWLDGERRAYVQCAADAEGRGPYCAAHAGKAFGQGAHAPARTVAPPRPNPEKRARSPRSPRVAASTTGPKLAAPDMVGQRFGRLVVVARAGVGSRGLARWACACDCGGETLALGGNLRRGGTTQCGPCGRAAQAETQRARRGPPRERKVRSPHLAPDMTGQRFGRLVVEGRAGVSSKGLVLWDCRCDCGGTRCATGFDLRQGIILRCKACAVKARAETIKARHAARRAAGESWCCVTKHGDLIGKRFGALEVQARVENDADGRTMWSCLCDCGNTYETRGGHLRAGKVWRCRSCAHKAGRVTQLATVRDARRGAGA